LPSFFPCEWIDGISADGTARWTMILSREYDHSKSFCCIRLCQIVCLRLSASHVYSVIFFMFIASKGMILCSDGIYRKMMQCVYFPSTS
jgi:hypothetical protein